MTDFEELIAAVERLRADLEDHKVATANMYQRGPVVDREHGKGVRVDLGAEEGKDKSSWVRMAEPSGVASDLPRKGEQVMVLAPYGDPRQGIAIPFGHSDEKKDPAADGDESVLFNRDGCKISVKGGKVTWEAKQFDLKVGKHTITLADGKYTLNIGGKNYTFDGSEHKFDGKVKNEGRNIGSDHIHSGVVTGMAKTQGPEV